MFLKLLIGELRFRLVGSLLAVAAVLAAAGLFVAGPTMLASYANDSRVRLAAEQQELETMLRKHDDDTRKTMLKLGFNVRIVHRDTNLSALLSDYAAVDMPREYAVRLANTPSVNKVAHLAATLIHPVTLDNRKRMLIGYAPEEHQANSPEKKPIGFDIAQNTAILGYEAARGRKPGETVDVLGRAFKIAQVLDRRDSHDDLMVAVNLANAQQLLGKPEKINAILAISCRCTTNDRIGEVAEQVTKLLPDVQVTESGARAGVRAEQREAAKRLLEERIAKNRSERQTQASQLATLTDTVTPLVVLASAIWVGVLAWTNVMARRTEIGLLRAIGKSSLSIAGLFLAKAALLGLCGGAAGAALGYFAGRQWAMVRFAVGSEMLETPATVVVWAVIGAPLVALVASYLPTILALRQDPAVVLRDT